MFQRDDLRVLEISCVIEEAGRDFAADASIATAGKTIDRRQTLAWLIFHSADAEYRSCLCPARPCAKQQ